MVRDFAYCTCVLHADDVTSCAARAPAWRNEFTGTGGALLFRLQDWAWGNTMMALRDALAVALILNRRPHLIVGPRQPPLNGANISSALDLFGVTVHEESMEARRQLAVPAGARVVASVAQLHAMVRRPPAPSQPIYSRILFSFMADVQEQMQSFARAHLGRNAWAELFTASVPDCWPAAFMRPAKRVRDAVLPLVQGTAKSVHLRVCNLVSWTDTCIPVEAPHIAARGVLGCALSTTTESMEEDQRLTRLFVASDSSTVLASLGSDARAGNLTLIEARTPQSATLRVTLSTLTNLGSTAHLSKLDGVAPADAQLLLDRAVFDWGAFAYSRRVVALPSSFPASAVCMFSPRQTSFVILQLPARDGTVECHRPLASSTGPELNHPCKDIVRVNAKKLRRSSQPMTMRKQTQPSQQGRRREFH